jgi:hypothetical protein
LGEITGSLDAVPGAGVYCASAGTDRERSNDRLNDLIAILGGLDGD